MISKKPVLLVVVIAIVSTLTACGGSSSSPAPVTPLISVALQASLPKSIGVSTGIPMTATVTNDSSNAGVDWTATCGSNDCGSFSATHTASGTATTYTTPATTPSGGTVVVTAASTKNPARTATDTLTIAAAPISVSFQPAPPASRLTGATPSITAQ
jgi:hypothetical protein